MWHIHTMEYYSALKRKEILAHATTWMNLKDIMLNEISPTRKDKYCTIPLIRGSQNSQIHKDSKQNGGCQEPGGRRTGQSVFNGYKVLVGKDKKVLEMNGDDGYTTTQTYLLLLNCMLKNG